MYRSVSASHRPMGVAAVALVATLTGGLSDGMRPATADPLDNDSTIELGGHLGIVTGGNTSTGGLQLAGNLLYRLTDIDWFEGGLSVVVGSGRAACFTDRQGVARCNHGSVDGRSGELSAGIRRYLLPQDAFTPYAHVSVALRLVSFPGDGVRGVAVPVVGGLGVRAHVSDVLSVGGGARFEGGVALLDQDLGVQPVLALNVYFAVEFRLD